MICSIADVNHRLREDAAAFIRQTEEAYDRRMTEIAAHIRDHADTCPVVLISGPSGSGKTTSALILEKKLDAWGLETHTLSMDNYFRTLTPEQHALLAEEKLDLESPDRVDIPLLNAQLAAIAAGEPVELPRFEFHTHARAADTTRLCRKPGEILILEGIHVLNPAVVALPEDQTVRLYVSVRTRVQTDGESVIHPQYIRLFRRMLRDIRYRGRSVTHTYQMFDSVQRGENTYIMPYKSRSTFDIDTFCPYELNAYRSCLLKPLQELSSNPDMAFWAALLEQAEPLDPALVPSTALVQEFLGNSAYYT